MKINTLAIALVTSWLAVSASAPAAAGPIPTMTAAVAQAAPDHAIDVYWRGGWRGGGFGWRGYGPGLAFGLAAGAIAGAAIAAPYYGGGPTYYYGAPMPSYYSRPVYAAPPYAYAPVYAPPVYGGGYYAPYGYSYGYRRCYTDEGYGRWTPCDTTGQR
ncbi:MAG: hypothetical protein WCE79_24415 [Xanthobacteraceae bacterium]